MGITGLLPFLNKSLREVHISHLKNSTVGIDGNSWIYQIGQSIAIAHYYNKKPTHHFKILDARLKIFAENNITPIFVFDGKSLPSKNHTNEKRRQDREKIEGKIEKLLEQKKRKDAEFLMRQVFRITPEFMENLIENLTSRKIKYIISPYESDAQLTYLQRQNIIQYIITEDSDLIIYNCTNILYKFNKESGFLFTRERMAKQLDIFTFENLRSICILSGCDYLPNIKRVGLKTAIKLYQTYKGDLNLILEHLKSRNFDVPDKYLEEFCRAEETFHSQVVFDPVKNKKVYLCTDENDKNEYVGSIDEEITVNSLEIKKSPYFN